MHVCACMIEDEEELLRSGAKMLSVASRPVDCGISEV